MANEWTDLQLMPSFSFNQLEDALPGGAHRATTRTPGATGAGDSLPPLSNYTCSSTMVVGEAVPARPKTE